MVRSSNALSAACFAPHLQQAAPLSGGSGAPIDHTHFASGSGRSWNFTTLLVVPLPPSM
jgi:hypothetical protein